MTDRNDSPLLKVGLAQVAPAVLDREATLSKVVQHTAAAAEIGCARVSTLVTAST